MAAQAPDARRWPARVPPLVLVVTPLALAGLIATAGFANADPTAAPSTPSSAPPGAVAGAKSGPGPVRAGRVQVRTATTPITTGTLTVASSTVQQGAALTFSFAAPADKVSTTNWIGLYSNPGNGPADQTSVGPSTLYQYVPSAAGTVTFDTAQLGPGAYIAYYLYNDGYSWLAQPVTFTVTAVPPTGTLTAGAGDVQQGEQLTFAYTSPADKVNAANWIGVYSDPGNGPVDQRYVGGSTIWQYVPDASGSATFSTAALPPGAYIAFYLYDDGYTWLAKPVTFTVTPVPPVAPPVYQRAFDGNGKDRLAAPAGLALDAKGNVFVADTGNDRIVEFTAAGKKVRAFGAKGTGNGRLMEPTAVTIDHAGEVFVADTGNDRVVEFSATGTFLRWFGGYGTGDGRLSGPKGITVDAAGNVYVGDTGNNRVVKFTAKGGYISAITKLAGPKGLRVDGSGNLWVAEAGSFDAGPDDVAEYSPSGARIGSLGASQNSGYGGLSNPSDVALDSTGHAYVAVPDFGWVEEFSTRGPYLNEFGVQDPGLLSAPAAVATGPHDEVYVADTGNDRIVVFGPKHRTN